MKSSSKAYFNEKGYSTVFFALMTLVFLGVFSLCATTLTQIMQSNEQMRQASLASRHLLSYYDDALESGYGILAYKASAVNADEIFQPYFDKNWRVTPKSTLNQLASFQEQAIGLGKIALAEQGVTALTDQTTKVTTPTSSETPRAEPTRPTSYNVGGAEERKDTTLSEGQRRRAREMKRRLGQGAEKQWQIQSGGIIEAQSYASRTNYDRATAKSLSLADRALMAAYLKTYFNDYVQWQKSPESIKNSDKRCFQGGELEYILEGKPNASTNQAWINGKIFVLREGVNLLHIVQSKEKMTTTGSLATLICALFPLGEPLVQAGLVALWAGIESGYEVNLLLEGKSIPAVKLNGGDWYTDLETGVGHAPVKKDSKAAQVNQIDYTGFLTLFLMAQEDAVTAERAMNLIELNLKKSGQDLGPLEKLVTSHRVWVKGKTGKEISFEDGYLENKESKGQSKR